MCFVGEKTEWAREWMIGSRPLSSSSAELKEQFKNPHSHCNSEVEHKATQSLWGGSEQESYIQAVVN